MLSADAKMLKMRTTIRIDDALYRKLKAEAARRGSTIGELIEDAVRTALAQSRRIDHDVRPLPVHPGGGLMPGVDLTSNAALGDVMDEDTALDALR